MTEFPLTYWILATLAAAAVSAVTGWKVQHTRQQKIQQALQQELEQAQQQLATAEQQLQTVQQDGQRLQTEVAQHQIEQTRWQERAESLQQQQRRLEQQYDELQQQSRELQQELTGIQRQLATEKEARSQEQRSAEEKLQLLEQSKEQMLKEFEHLSHKIFEEKNRQFSEQSQKGLDSLLSPFKDQLEGLRKKVDDVYVADAKDRTELKTQIESLHKLNQQITAEAHALTTALRGEKKMQGNWGEMVLETVLDRSGLRKGEEYVREQVRQDDGGRSYRPDVIINLPEGKHIVIDAKVSLNAYTDYVNADDDGQREAAAKRHTDAVRHHIRSLSEKAYQQLEGLNSPDFVFLFMPVEPAFMLAFQQDEALFTEAFEKRIVVVTPTTLLATLRTVASIWAIERRNRSTEKLAEQAGKVYDKLVLVVERFEKVGTQLNTVQKSYDEAWNSMKTGRGNLLSQADNFRKLGVRAKKELAKTLVEDANAEADLFDNIEQQTLLSADD